MNSYILILSLIFANALDFKRQPTIVIVDAQETTFTSEFDSVMNAYLHSELSKEAIKHIKKENGRRFKFKTKKEIEFLSQSSYTSALCYGLNYYLSYKIFEHFPNLLVYPVSEKIEEENNSLKEVAIKHKVNWVLSLKKVHLFTKEERKYGEITFEVYNKKTDRILLSDKVMVDDSNPGFTFSCEFGTLDCIYNNGVAIISAQFLDLIGSKKEYWEIKK